MGPCNRHEGRICAQEREGVPVVQEREGRSVRVYFQTIEKKVYQTLKVASNSTSVLCGKKGWEEENCCRLKTLELVSRLNLIPG